MFFFFVFSPTLYNILLESPWITIQGESLGVVKASLNEIYLFLYCLKAMFQLLCFAILSPLSGFQMCPGQLSMKFEGGVPVNHPSIKTIAGKFSHHYSFFSTNLFSVMTKLSRVYLSESMVLCVLSQRIGYCSLKSFHLTVSLHYQY